MAKYQSLGVRLTVSKKGERKTSDRIILSRRFSSQRFVQKKVLLNEHIVVTQCYASASVQFFVCAIDATFK